MSGSFPHMVLARDLGIPYGVVLLYSEGREKLRMHRNPHEQRAVIYAQNILTPDVRQQLDAGLDKISGRA